MSSKTSDAARNAVAAAATGSLFRQKPAPNAQPAPNNIVTLDTESGTSSTEPLPKEDGKGTKPGKGTVRATYKRVMLYLPPKAKRKIQEIAFTTERKPHDVFLEALREYLERSGHPGLL